MTKILLTGGSGFIATHILHGLIKEGHTVVTTVRTQAKADQIVAAYPGLPKGQLTTALVPELAREDAFDEVVQTPGLEVVLHTASPFHFKSDDFKKDIIDPAVIGTTGILKSLVKYAPQVRRVVVTSSFAAIVDYARTRDSSTVFTEADWNPIELAQVKDKVVGYSASKKLAERAAWDFVAAQKPNFDLVTVNPPLVFGPVLHHLEGLASINTSNGRVVDAVSGLWKTAGEIPETGVYSFVDVRDVAKAHILAVSKPEVGGKRLFAVSGSFSNRKIVDIIRANFPEYADKLPPASAPGGDFPDALYTADNSATTKLLGFEWTPLETSIVDTVNSLKTHVEKEIN